MLDSVYLTNVLLVLILIVLVIAHWESVSQFANLFTLLCVGIFSVLVWWTNQTSRKACLLQNYRMCLLNEIRLSLDSVGEKLNTRIDVS